MTLDKPQAKLRIAIVGGGLIGTFASIVLSSLPNVQVTTFEKSPIAREAGAWISLTESALAILSRFIDIDELHAITATPKLGQYYIYRDWETEEVLHKQQSVTTEDIRYQNSKTHRAALLNLFLKHVPEGIIKYGHKVEDVVFNSDDDHSVSLKFEGIEQEQEFDLVVAADGIYSKIRTKLYPEIVVEPKGAVAYRNIFPEDLVKHIENYRRPNGGTLTYRSGSEIVFLSQLGLGQYGLVVIVPEPPEVVQRLKWDHRITEDELHKLRDRFKKWPKVVRELLEASPYFNAFPLESAPWLEHLSYKNRLAFVGDAAHPTSGAFGSGAAFGYGDVWALYRALEDTASNTPKRKRARLNDKEFIEEKIDAYDVSNALFLFDETRRYFLKDVYEQIARDRKNGEYVNKGNDLDEMRERSAIVTGNFSWLYEHNVELEYQRVRSKHIDRLYK